MTLSRTRNRLFFCSLSALAAIGLSGCASTAAEDQAQGSYERPEYTTGSNLPRKNKDAGRLPDNVKLVDKEAFQAGLPGAAGAAAAASAKGK